MGHGQGTVEDLGLNAAFWSGRRVLVTGHTGFKGSWLALWLESLGAQVSGYGLAPPGSPSMFEDARVGADMTSLEGDVRDRTAVRAAVEQVRPEVVLHLAAQPLVRLSYRQPVETFGANVLGTVHLLDAVREVGGVRVVVCVTTDKVYENRGLERGYREDDELGGHDPYSASKASAELVASAYRRSFLAEAGTRVASARAGNVIGGGDWGEDRLVPDVARAWARGEPVVVRSPDAVRPWQHVLNPLSGYLALVERLWDDESAAGAWNFGPDEDDAWPVGAIVERLAGHWGLEVQIAPEGGPHEAAFLRLDSSKAHSELGWRPRWALERALDATAEWYSAHRAGEDMRAASLAQIRAFVAAAAPA